MLVAELNAQSYAPRVVPVPRVAPAPQPAKLHARRKSRMAVRVLSEAPRGRTKIAWGAAPGRRTKSIPIHPLATAAARPQQSPRGKKRFLATATWGCAPGCLSAAPLGLDAAPGQASTRKVTPRCAFGHAQPENLRASARNPKSYTGHREDGTRKRIHAPNGAREEDGANSKTYSPRVACAPRVASAPQPAKLHSQASGARSQPENLRAPPSAGAGGSAGNPQSYTPGESHAWPSQAPRGRTKIAWGAAPGRRTLFLFTSWRLLRLGRSSRQGERSGFWPRLPGAAPQAVLGPPPWGSMQRPVKLQPAKLHRGVHLGTLNSKTYALPPAPALGEAPATPGCALYPLRAITPATRDRQAKRISAPPILLRQVQLAGRGEPQAVHFTAMLDPDFAGTLQQLLGAQHAGPIP